jgi:hypothetical protein
MPLRGEAPASRVDARNGKYSLALKQDLGGKPVSRLYTVAAKWAPRFLHRPGRFVTN